MNRKHLFITFASLGLIAPAGIQADEYTDLVKRVEVAKKRASYYQSRGNMTASSGARSTAKRLQTQLDAINQERAKESSRASQLQSDIDRLKNENERRESEALNQRKQSAIAKVSQLNGSSSSKLRGLSYNVTSDMMEPLIKTYAETSSENLYALTVPPESVGLSYSGKLKEYKLIPLVGFSQADGSLSSVQYVSSVDKFEFLRTLLASNYDLKQTGLFEYQADLGNGEVVVLYRSVFNGSGNYACVKYVNKTRVQESRRKAASGL